MVVLNIVEPEKYMCRKCREKKPQYKQLLCGTSSQVQLTSGGYKAISWTYSGKRLKGITPWKSKKWTTLQTKELTYTPCLEFPFGVVLTRRFLRRCFDIVGKIMCTSFAPRQSKNMRCPCTRHISRIWRLLVRVLLLGMMLGPILGITMHRISDKGGLKGYVFAHHEDQRSTPISHCVQCNDRLSKLLVIIFHLIGMCNYNR